MALSMYQSSIPMLKRMLGSLAAILDKAVAHAEAKKIDPAAFVETKARIAARSGRLSAQEN